jgi:hypothetical protein
MILWAAAALACGPYIMSSVLLEELSFAPPRGFDSFKPQGLSKASWLEPKLISTQSGEKQDTYSALATKGITGAAADRVWRSYEAYLQNRGEFPKALPEEFRLYREAVDLLSEGNGQPGLDALHAFVKLPYSKRKWCSTWAFYTIGNIAATTEESEKAYQEVRKLAKAGAKDTLGLALASLRMEAEHTNKLENAISLCSSYRAQGGTYGCAGFKNKVHKAFFVADARLKAIAAEPIARQAVTALLASEKYPVSECYGGEEACPPEGRDPSLWARTRWLNALKEAGKPKLQEAGMVAWLAYDMKLS